MSEKKHYKVVCISMYNKDVERSDELVAKLKSLGYYGANRSWLIRRALEQFDIDKLEVPHLEDMKR